MDLKFVNHHSFPQDHPVDLGEHFLWHNDIRGSEMGRDLGRIDERIWLVNFRHARVVGLW